MKSFILFIYILLFPALLLGNNSHLNDPVIEDHVDLIELNHYYYLINGRPKLMGDQILYYNFKRTVVGLDHQYMDSYHCGDEECEECNYINYDDIGKTYGYKYELVDYRIIRNGRETVDNETFRQRELEFQKQWKKLNGSNVAPSYEVPFIDKHFCPILKDHKTGYYFHTYKDNEVGLGLHMRKVTAKSYRETWTIGDPEAMASALIPYWYRQRLTSKPFGRLVKRISR